MIIRSDPDAMRLPSGVAGFPSAIDPIAIPSPRIPS